MGAHLHRTLKFLPRATCRRDRLLPMASTRVTMSEPKPGGRVGSRLGGVARMRVEWELGGEWENGFPGGLTIIRQIQGAHCASIAHQVLYHLSARGAQLKVEAELLRQQAAAGEARAARGPRSPGPLPARAGAPRSPHKR